MDDQAEANAIRATLREKARAAWPGESGERRARELDRFLDRLLPSYAQALGLPEARILVALEGARKCAATAYYQEANFPSIEDVVLVDSADDFRTRYPSGKFRCPCCAGVSTDPYECNSGLAIKGKTCDWKAYGLFGTMGKGMRVALRRDFLIRPKVEEIFSPIERESAHEGNAGPAPARSRHE